MPDLAEITISDSGTQTTLGDSGWGIDEIKSGFPWGGWTLTAPVGDPQTTDLLEEISFRGLSRPRLASSPREDCHADGIRRHLLSKLIVSLVFPAGDDRTVSMFPGT